MSMPLFRPPAPASPGLLAAPFDALRLGYARAVRAGVLPRSILTSSDLERLLDALERLLLGPLARRV